MPGTYSRLDPKHTCQEAEAWQCRQDERPSSVGQGAPPGRLLLCVLSLPSRMDVYTAPVLYRPDLCRLRLARSLEAAAEKAAALEVLGFSFKGACSGFG